MDEDKRSTILLIEDDEVIRDLYRKIFEFRGYRVIEAVDGNDGIEKFLEHRNDISLLVTDVMMPGKNGREAYEEIIKTNSDVKIIFTSGYNSELTKQLQDEGFHYLKKPFSPEELLQRIAEVLGEGRNI